MKKEDLFETINDIDEKYVKMTDTYKPKKKTAVWLKWVATAACLCLVVSGVLVMVQINKNNTMTGSSTMTGDPIKPVDESNSNQDESNNIPGAAHTENAVVEYPALIMVHGILYYDSAELSAEGAQGEYDGIIDSKCEGDIPTEDNQSNFGTGYGYKVHQEKIDVLIDGDWHVFKPFIESEWDFLNGGINPASTETTYTYEDETTDSEIQIESQDFKPTE